MSKEMLSTSAEIPKHKNALEEKYQAASDLTEDKKVLDPETIENQRWYNHSTRIIRKITYSHELWLCNQVRTVGLSWQRKISNRTVVQKRTVGYFCKVRRIKITHRRRRSSFVKWRRSFRNHRQSWIRTS